MRCLGVGNPRQAIDTFDDMSQESLVLLVCLFVLHPHVRNEFDALRQCFQPPIDVQLPTV